MKLDVFQEMEVCELYTQGKSTRDLGKLFLVDKSTISGILRRNNVNIRSFVGTSKNRPTGLQYLITAENKGWFKKGTKISEGRIVSDSTKQNMSKSQTLRFQDPKEREIISFNVKKTMESPEIREKCRYWLGKQMTEETKQKMSESRIGEKHWNWLDGRSYEDYPTIFNKALKAKIRKRDNYICQLCKITEQESLVKYRRKLAINHIDFNKQNCEEYNLNTLCCSCNAKINFNRKFWTDYFMGVSQ